MDLTVSLPDEVARTTGLNGADASDKARFLLLLELYREGRLSFGRLGALAGLAPAELMERMTVHGTYLNYSLEDLAHDRRSAP